MQRTATASICLAAIFLIAPAGCTALPGRRHLADVPLVRTEQKMPPPAWAVKQRQLLQANAEALRQFVGKYYDERGYQKVKTTLGGGAGADDATEPTWNWSLLYALGGNDDVLEMLRFAWEGHYKQYTEAGGLAQEFIKSFDWQHNGEQYCSFYRLGLCDPYDAKYRERARRFADFYLGMPNYDPELKIIRSVMNGSEGPNMNATMADWGGTEFFRFWTGKNVRGDTPLNLQATSLVATAFRLTGDEKYRRWIIEYVDAWLERAEANNGNFPGNVGLSGKVGEDWPDPGKQFCRPEFLYLPEDATGMKIYPWAGGIMGWSGWSGPSMVISGIRMGLKNAFLMTPDEKYLRAGERQLRNIRDGLKLGETADGKPIIADVRGYDSQKQWLGEDIYLLDMKGHADWFEQHYGPGKGRGYGYYEMGHTLDWIAYLWGRNPDFPEKILDSAISGIRSQQKRISEDKSKDWEREANICGFNPVRTAALTMLTTGAREPSWRGSPLVARLRYFDPERGRPGLPPDVAALVDAMNDTSVSFTLVNLSKTDARTVVVQGGAYAEHHIIQVQLAGGRESKVDGPAFAVALPPGSGQRLTVEMKPFAATPTFDYPWRRNKGQ